MVLKNARCTTASKHYAILRANGFVRSSLARSRRRQLLRLGVRGTILPLSLESDWSSDMIRKLRMATRNMGWPSRVKGNSLGAGKEKRRVTRNDFESTGINSCGNM